MKNPPNMPAVAESLRQVIKDRYGSVLSASVAFGIDQSKLYRFLNLENKKIPGYLYQIDRDFDLALPFYNALIELGNYSKNDFENLLVGTHRTVIVSRGSGAAFESFKTTIEWKSDSANATFVEKYRTKARNHSGRIATFEGSNVTYMLSNSANGHGYRQICVKRKDSNRGDMCGFLSSVTRNIDSVIIPFVCQIAYIFSEEVDYPTGFFDDGSEEYPLFCSLFERLSRDIGFSYGIRF